MNNQEAYKHSYTAAGTFPVKLLRIPHLLHRMVDGQYITPYHLQLVPTNRCNLCCEWCSCENENRNGFEVFHNNLIIR